MYTRSRLAALFQVLAVMATMALSPSVFAQDKHAEAVAKDAQKRTLNDFRTSAFDDAIAQLSRALKECGSSKCSSATRAALHRDLGVMQFRKGYRQQAAASFVAALRLEPSLEMNPAFDAPDVKRDWFDAREEAVLAAAAPTTGDFLHTPPAEQTPNTPVPIYVEYAGEGALATVTVKYRGNEMGDYKRVSLARSGNGWGGLLPCADVTRGPMRYYIQGFDANNEPVATSGDPKHPFYVRIRSTLLGPAPSLPGASPPAKCGGGESSSSASTSREAQGEACEDDSQCSSKKCASGHCVVPREEGEEDAGPAKEYARWWVGLAGSVDIVPLQSGSDVCILSASGTPQGAGYYCANTDGSDFPQRRTTEENNQLVPGKGGQVGGGPGLGGVRILASLDYALSSRFLIGLRAGYVANTYPGKAASHDGHAFTAPLHFELRGTLLFGEAPLARAGLAPLVLVGAGVGNFGADATTLVSKVDVLGQTQERAWQTGGPFFASLGAGARFAFSTRAAFLGAIKGTAAFGGFNTLFAISPEIALQYGF